MNPLKIKPFTLRILLLCACLLVMIACTEETYGQDNGTAHFESGLKAVDVNNMPLAYKEFLASAKEGHAYSQYNVALMYEQGLGVSKNDKEAFFWYGKSASQGNSGAQFNLGVLFENGRD